MDEFSFCEWLEKKMEKHKLSPYSMAKVVGHSPFSIYQYLKCERSPTLMVMNDYLNAFGERLIVVNKGDSNNG